MTSESPLPEISTIRESASEVCALLKVLANEDRLLLLCEISQGSKNVSELKALLDIRQPTLPQQLTVLREEQLVTTERKRKYIYYHMASPQAARVMQALFELFCKNRMIKPQESP